ncbi:MAG TPA: sigma-54 dependent transcriptional regulator [Pyrinomonadaceae bacterium]|jgi:transcriptional regulator with PAS, ATPase and Fis domain|nr:sigma-54 dependent transcriptional regulator [Pyrinomonadaceae bacterium]
MIESLDSESTTPVLNHPSALPVDAIVRTVCEAALAGPEFLYEAMLKLSLAVEAVAPTYGLSIWSVTVHGTPRVKWAEGLDAGEIDEAERVVAATITNTATGPQLKAGDVALCLPLALPSLQHEGAAIYARCVRPLTTSQARSLRSIIGVTQLAHAYATTQTHHRGEFELSPKASSSNAGLPGMVFSSRVMAAVALAVQRIKDSESPVLITGESGTGKELIARAIHRLSKRSDREFIPFNCSAVPAELVESILFGHRKGSFTGALTENQGLIRAAENGTLFLDEIGDLPLALQPKLLRFLQESEIHTLGESAPRKVNVRVIAATHKELQGLIRQNLFREDLYYRIAGLQISVPPLRDRPEDTALLISHFVTHYSRRNDRHIAGITGDAIRVLESYSWPGNVRELAAEIERLVLYAEENGYINRHQIHQRILPDNASQINDETERSLEQLLDEYERRVITQTLKEHDCNVARTSAALGLGSRQTLYKKLKRLAIDVGEFLQEDTKPGLQLRTPPM